MWRKGLYSWVDICLALLYTGIWYTLCTYLYVMLFYRFVYGLVPWCRTRSRHRRRIFNMNSNQNSNHTCISAKQNAADYVQNISYSLKYICLNICIEVLIPRSRRNRFACLVDILWVLRLSCRLFTIWWCIHISNENEIYFWCIWWRCELSTIVYSLYNNILFPMACM